MLDNIFNEKLITLNIEAKNWEDAIRKTSQPLIDCKKASKEYVDDMILSVKQFGPYIVLSKHIAMPHGRPEKGAKECAIAIGVLKTPVEFGNIDNDPVKYIFSLSATDNTSHLKAIVKLADLFKDKEFFKLLDNASSPKEIIEYLSE